MSTIELQRFMDDGQPEAGAPVGASRAPLPLTRRRVLRVVGGTAAFIAVAAVVGGTARAVDRGVFATGEGPAYAAWLDQGGEGPLGLVRAAVLASNAHNTQPWLFRVQASGIDLFADTTRGTGANDPLGRELVISLGCALENLLVAAGPHGLLATPTLFPDSADPNHVAHVALTPAEPAGSPLYDAIPNRHTNRAAYTEVPIEAETLAAMTGLNDMADVDIVWLTTPEEKTAFGALTIAATEAFIADTEQSVDSFAWFRSDWDEVQRLKDGLTLDAAGLPPLTRAFVKMMPDISRAESDQAWLKSTRDPQLATAAAFGILVARDHQAAAQRLEAGRLFQRLHLWATAEGMAMQPINQTVERRDRELSASLPPDIGSALAALMPEPGWQALMPFRIGYPAEPALKSPRRPAAEVVVA